MSELLSVGLDVGTTTTQMIVSRLQVENRASGFAVPEMVITDRQILYRSPVHFTPLKGGTLVDGERLRELVQREYENAGITRDCVDTGAIIITGETSRKENAGEVLQALSDFAGSFVVTTAGPDMESVLAAKGAGAVDVSGETGKTLLHMDIGGGTSNLALIRNGQVERTGCLNVGGRLIKLNADGVVTYVSPVLSGLTNCKVGDKPALSELEQAAKRLCRALETAAGREKDMELLRILQTREVQQPWQPPEEPVTVSFSGGVADCIHRDCAPLQYGDLGPLLGKAIADSTLCRQAYMLGAETIRATVIGAGCHSTRLSGSTVFCRNTSLPKKNIPVLRFTRQQQESHNFAQLISHGLSRCDNAEAILALPGYQSPGYGQVTALAQTIEQAVGNRPVYVCLEADMAKALGQRLSMLLPDRPVLCLDRLRFGAESYLDIGEQVGPCYPVVIKTLVLSANQKTDERE